MVKKVLFVATVVKTHINTFHLPFLKMFKEHGWEVHVAAKNDFVDEPCVIPNCDRHFDIAFERFPFSKQNLTAYNQLKYIIQENHYDIIHCHTPVAGVLARLAARSSKDTTVIYTAHGFHFYKGAPLLNWLVCYPVERFCAKFTDKLITINQEDYNRAKGWSLRNNGKVYYVPGVGVDINKFHNIDINKKEKRKSLGIDENTKILLSVGELIKRKNHEVIIRSLSKLKDKNFVYIICGRGPLLEQLKELAVQLGLEKKVKLLGFRKDIAEICKIADLFVFPSIHEGLPVALMEAIASNIPAIASDIRGNRDLLSSDSLCKSNKEDEWRLLLEYKKIKKQSLDKKYYVENIMEKIRAIYGL